MAANSLFKNSASDIYNCGYGQGYSVKEVIAEVENIINSKLKVETGPRREKDIAVSIANSDRHIDLKELDVIKKYLNIFELKLYFRNLNP